MSKFCACFIVLLASFAQAQQPYSSTVSVSKLLAEAEAPVTSAPTGGDGAPTAMTIARPSRPFANSARCASGEATKDECREHWKPMLKESLAWVLTQNGMNLALGPDFRHAISHGNFWSNYHDALVANAHSLSHWNDGDEFLVSYVGHPMMGATVDSIYIQNDPKAANLQIGKSKAYWTSRGRAMLFGFAYAAQWKVGPLGEATIGNVGQNYYTATSGKVTNGAGMIDYVITPVGGTAFRVGEDVIDRFVASKLREKTENRLVLTSISFLTPTKGMANVMRFKSPWYRDPQ